MAGLGNIKLITFRIKGHSAEVNPRLVWSEPLVRSVRRYEEESKKTMSPGARELGVWVHGDLNTLTPPSGFNSVRFEIN